MAKDIKIAAIGAGRMGLTHVRNLGTIAGVTVAVAADVQLAVARNAQQLCRAERATDDIAAAIQSPDVDAVVISTPTNTHAALIELAARAGKAIWCEKPIALTLAETRRVAQVVREAGVACQLGFMRRFDPGYAAAKRKIEAGEIGRIETFRALSRDNAPPPYDYLKTSGGIFLDMAVHDLDLARFLVGEVAEVQAWGDALLDLPDDRFRRAGDIDTACALLRFENGALGVLETARRSEWGYDIRTEIAGSTGKLVIDAPQKTPLLHSRRRGFEGDLFESFPDRFADAYRLELQAFVEAIQTGGPAGPGPDDAYKTLQLAIAVTQSWRSGARVSVAAVTG